MAPLAHGTGPSGNLILKIMAALDSHALHFLTPKQVETLVESLRVMTSYDHDKLRARSFELLNDFSMRNKSLVSMMNSCKIITSESEARHFQDLENNIGNLSRLMEDMRMYFAYQQNQGLHSAMKSSADAVTFVVDACENPKLRSILMDRNYHGHIIDLLELIITLTQPKVVQSQVAMKAVSKKKKSKKAETVAEAPEVEMREVKHALREHETFGALVTLCMDAIAILAQESQQSQTLITERGLLTAILPALEIEPTRIAAVQCIQSLMTQNRVLCEKYCGSIVVAIVDALNNSAGAAADEVNLQFRLACLDLLPYMMESKEEVYEDCQLLIARKLSTSPQFLALDCVELVSGGGGGFSREQMIREACNDDETLEQSSPGVRVYVAGLNALAVCAKGTISAVEALCHAMFTSETCIVRLLELEALQSTGQCSGKSELFVACKRCLISYLDEVCADTKLETILHKLREAKNGIWLPNDGTNDRVNTIMQMMSTELSTLDQMYASGETGDKLNSFREYVFNVCLPFVNHLLKLARKWSLQQPDELNAAMATLHEMTTNLQLCSDSLGAGRGQIDGSITNEKESVDSLSAIVSEWAEIPQGSMMMKSSDTSSRVTTTSSLPLYTVIAADDTVEMDDEINHQWNSFCLEFVDTLHVKRDSPLTGHTGIWAIYAPSGLVKAAELLWGVSIVKKDDADSAGDSAYARDLIQSMLKNLHSFSNERLLEALDILRMMLYCVPRPKGAPPTLNPDFMAKIGKNSTSSLPSQALEIQAFVANAAVHFVDKAVAAAQYKLIKYGILGLCLQIIRDETISMNSPALRLMRAALDGNAVSSQVTLLKQLVASPHELFITCYRRLLSVSIQSFGQVYIAAKLSKNAYKQAVKLSGVVQSGEAMAIINAVCTGDAQDMQVNGFAYFHHIFVFKDKIEKEVRSARWRNEGT